MCKYGAAGLVLFIFRASLEHTQKTDGCQNDEIWLLLWWRVNFIQNTRAEDPSPFLQAVICGLTEGCKKCINTKAPKGRWFFFWHHGQKNQGQKMCLSRANNPSCRASSKNFNFAKTSSRRWCMSWRSRRGTVRPECHWQHPMENKK